MPRKKNKARRVPMPKRIRVRPNVIIISPCKMQDDGISLGRLVAIAEWRG